MTGALVDRFSALSDAERGRAYGDALCVALFLVHCSLFSSWQIEDAAITYAYATHFANGDGLVVVPGGEWVEGFSNPTWTLLLAAFAFVGVSPWVAGKLLGIAAAACALPLATAWTRRLAPDAAGPWPLLAPLGLATSTQYALWASSGLENGLFCLLLAAGAVGLLRDADRPTRGLSGLALGLLAITRPEGPMYAGLLALVGAPAAWRAGGARWLAGFVAASGLPFVGWHAWRYQVFAWPLPNTWYAKQGGSEKFAPWAWNAGGWSYLRSWALASVQGFLVPIYAIGQTGAHGWRGAVGVVATGLLVGALIPGAGWLRDRVPFPDEPALAVQIRVLALAAALVLFPLLGVGRTGATARIAAAATAGAALFFALYTGGDWMKGYRWMNLGAVPLAVLLADGARTVAEAVRPALAAWWTRLDRPSPLASALVLPAVIGGVIQTTVFLFAIETTPFDVRRRVLYMQGVQERLHLDRVRLLEVDMGAHMMWSGFDLIDMAGLCDVPIARHHYQTAFIDAYLHEERVPTFAHVHGNWAGKTRIDKRPWFQREYVEIPGYAQGGHLHVGNHIRRDLFIQPSWPGTDARQARFGGGLSLDGLDVPAPIVAPGGGLYVELGWSVPRRAHPAFRAVLFLARGERVVARELPPAYDWIPVDQWNRAEVMVGRHTLSLPDDLEPGAWDLGLVVFGEAGAVWPAADSDPGRAARYAAGEVVWSGAIDVRPREIVAAHATSGVDGLIAVAATGDCERAERAWSSARRHLPPTDPWHRAQGPRTRSALARCWAARAGIDDADAIRRAREHDFRDAEVRRVAHAFADRREAAGDAAAAAGDDDGAWRGWSDTLIADPSRAWVRRRLEALRVRRLGLKEIP